MPKHLPQLPKATMEDLALIDAQIQALNERKAAIVNAVLRALNVKIPKGNWAIQPDGQIIPAPKPRVIGEITEKQLRGAIKESKRLT